MGEDTVSVSYRNDRDDVRAAALVAARVLPVRRTLRRVGRVFVVVAAGLWVLVLVMAGNVDGGIGKMTFPIALTLFIMLFSISLASDRIFAWQTARNPVSRMILGNASFRADAAGIYSSLEGSTGSFEWSRIEQVAEGRDALVFTIGSRVFYFVPTRVLSDADRTAMRQLAANGPEWLDLR